jgi:hypothetical protein
MSVFSQRNYKSAILALLERRRSDALNASQWTNTAIATACNVQKTYWSRVVNGQADLNGDQLFLALKFLDATLDERRFITLLHQRDRSELADRRSVLDKEISAFRTQAIDAKDHVSSVKSAASADGMQLYYLDPMVQLIHLFLTIDRYAEHPEQLTTKLGIASGALNSALSLLRSLGIITTRDRRVVVLKDSMHLPANSPIIKPYQIMNRLKGLEKLQRSIGKEQHAYTLFFSADDDARAEILTKFMLFLKQVETIVRPAKCAKVFQMQFDLLDWECP